LSILKLKGAIIFILKLELSLIVMSIPTSIAVTQK